MNARGKHTCKILKEIRQQIADANDIELVISECRYKGDCPGTCPKCEAEVRYLEQQLRARSLAGKAIALGGISAASLSMLMPGVATAQAPQDPENNLTDTKSIAFMTRELKGIVFGRDTVADDSVRTEPLIDALVVNNSRHMGVATNIDGEFTIPVATGDSLTISYIGCEPHNFIVTDDMKDLDVTLQLQQLTEVIAGRVYVPKSTGPHYTDLNIIDRNGNPIDPDDIDIERVWIDAEGKQKEQSIAVYYDKKHPIMLDWNKYSGTLTDDDGLPLKEATLRVSAIGYADPILIKLHCPEHPVKHTVIFPAQKDSK